MRHQRRAAGSWMLGLIVSICAGCSQRETSATSPQTVAGNAGSAGEMRDGTAPTDDAARAGTAVSDAAAASGTGGNAAASGPAAGSSTGTPDAAASGSAGSMATSDAPPGGTAGNSLDTGCSRELLQTTTDTYYAALAAHDPAMLPSAASIKFTENGTMLALGEGLWQTAGMVKYKHTALDTETCSTVSESVVPDGSTDVPVGLRLTLAEQKITEVETIVVRPGDYKVFGSNFPSNTNAIAASKDVVEWEEPVPEDQRNTRAEIQDWLDKYFRLFPRYGCNLADDCQRLENGGGSFECNAALSCDMAAVPSERGTLIPRTFVIDSERGIGVGFTMFMGNTDFHMIKMYGGEIHAVHAILGAAESSGWE